MTPYDYRFIAAAPATAVGDDLNGDGNADLLTVGGKNSLPAGLWQATGTGGGKIDPVARNIGIDGNGVSTTQTATSFTGTQAITGHFFTGAGFNDVLDYGYDTSTGAVSGEILRGQGDGTGLQPVDSLPVTNSTGVFALTTTTTGDGRDHDRHDHPGHLHRPAAAASTTPSTERPPRAIRLLLVINGSLYDENAVPGAGLYPGRPTRPPTSPTTTPTASPRTPRPPPTAPPAGAAGPSPAPSSAACRPSSPATPATDTSDPSHGQLWYLSPDNLQTLTYDSLSYGATDATLTSVEASTSGWDSVSQPTLQAADINNDGTPDLWTT